MTKQTDAASHAETEAAKRPKGTILEILGASAKLGMTSFGGPIAHLGYFRNEYVKRRKWLDEKSYADLVALCQFLPGPTSSQVGIAIGMMRGGLPGGIASWIGFTLPSALALMLFAYLLDHADVSGAGWLHGLMIAAVAVVAQAVWGMARSLAPDRNRGTIAMLTAVIVLVWPSAYTQLILIAAAGLVGRWFLTASNVPETPRLGIAIRRRTAVAAWVVFVGLLLGLPLLRSVSPSQAWRCSTPFSASVRSFSAAATSCFRCSKPKWFPLAGSRKPSFLPDTGRLKRSRGPCSPSPLIWAPS